MGTLSHAERALLGLAEPDVDVLPLSDAEQAFAGVETVRRDLRSKPRPAKKNRHRFLSAVPDPDPEQHADPEVPVVTVEVPPLDLSEVTEALREIRDRLAETSTPAETEEAPQAFRFIRDKSGRTERVLVIERGFHASEERPASYRIVRDELGRMTSIEYEA